MTSKTTQQNKETVWRFWQELAGATRDSVASVVRSYVDENISWFGPHPINDLQGVEALSSAYWQPLLRSFPDLRRDTYVFLGGTFQGNEWVAGTGYLTGTFSEDWLGIPASGRETNIRFGEFCRVADGKIIEIYTILDLIDVMLQAGFSVLPRSRGDEGKWPGPTTGAGVLLGPQDDAVGRQSLRLVEDMIAGLGRFDGAHLGSMSMTVYWRPEMHWYGPAGIGAARSMVEYEDVHAGPFLRAFPDRKGGHHKARLAEGCYVASTGWPSVYATHRAEWLGQPATDKKISMRVMDFWRREGNFLVENWVFIDIVDLFLQFGIDLFDRIATGVR